MYSLITIFYVSLLAGIIMILYKRHEIKTGKPTILSKMGKGSDTVLHSIFSSIHTFLSYLNKHTFIAVAHWIAFHILVHIRKFYVEIKHHFISHPHGKRMIDAVRGRGEIKDHGASFYLRRISKNGNKQS